MKWLFFLHFYQPYNQKKEVLAEIVAECYRPVFHAISTNEHISPISVNICGSLLQLLDSCGYTDILDDIRKSVSLGRLELTGTAAYHSLLPLLPSHEIERQILLNEEIVHTYIPEARLEGFFPPEMAVTSEIARIIASLGYKWCLIDEIAVPKNLRNDVALGNTLYEHEGLLLVPRDRKLSNVIMSGVLRSIDEIKDSLTANYANKSYVLTGMDGETFGHHRTGLNSMLISLLSASNMNICNVTSYIDNTETVKQHIDSIQASTWASSQEDIDRNVQFLSWSDPENPIHKLQTELMHLAIACVSQSEASLSSRQALDTSLGSDHFWWASAKPWWSIEMIEEGAYRLLNVIVNIKDCPRTAVSRAHELYEGIVSTAFEWQRSGKIYKMMTQNNEAIRIPFKDRTLGKGGAEQGIYYAFIDMIKEQEKKAANAGNYEKAILWRDALYKLENKLDIYDAVHAVDLLRQELPYDVVEKILDKYTEPYKKIRGGQPEQRGN